MSVLVAGLDGGAENEREPVPVRDAVPQDESDVDSDAVGDVVAHDDWDNEIDIVCVVETLVVGD